MESTHDGDLLSRGSVSHPASGARHDGDDLTKFLPAFASIEGLPWWGGSTNADSVNGKLAGGMVMSLLTRRDSGLTIGVTSNMTHAKTASLAMRVADAFAEQTR